MSGRGALPDIRAKAGWTAGLPPARPLPCRRSGAGLAVPARGRPARRRRRGPGSGRPPASSTAATDRCARWRSPAFIAPPPPEHAAEAGPLLSCPGQRVAESGPCRRPGPARKEDRSLPRPADKRKRCSQPVRPVPRLNCDRILAEGSEHCAASAVRRAFAAGEWRWRDRPAEPRDRTGRQAPLPAGIGAAAGRPSRKASGSAPNSERHLTGQQ